MTPAGRRAETAAAILIAVLVVGLGVSAGARAFGSDDPARHRTDYTVYRAAGEAALRGEDPFDAHNVRGWLFNGLPVLALVCAPFACLPVEVGAVLWYVLAVLALGRAVRAATRAAGREFPTPLGPWTFALVALPFVLWPTLSGFSRLNPSTFCAAAVIYACATAAEGRETRAGLALAAATAVKAFPALMIPGLFLCGRRRTALVALVGIGALLLAPSLRYGLDGNARLVRRFVAAASAGANADPSDARYAQTFDPRLPKNQSLAAVATRVLVPDDLVGAGSALESRVRSVASNVGAAACVAAAFVARSARRRGRPFAAVALLALPATLASPLAWTHYFVVNWALAPVLVAAAADLGRRRAALAALGAWIAAQVVALAIPSAHAAGVGTAGAVVAWLVAARAAVRPADPAC